MAKSFNWGVGCITLFALPFAAGGIFGLVMAIRALLAHPPKWGEAGFLSIFFFVFGGVACWLILGAMFGSRRAKRGEAQKRLNPDQPWLWNEEWASGKIRCSSRGKMIGAWVFAGFWNAISFPSAFFAVRDAVLKQGKYEALIVLIFPLVGICLLVWAIRATISWKKFGTSILELASIPGVIGGKLAGVVLTNVKLHAEDGFHLKLSCINAITTGSGKNRSTREAALWESGQTLVRELLSGEGGYQSAIPVSFIIPYDCRQTDNADSDNRVLWRLEVVAKVPGVDYEAQFEVPVFKTETSSAEPAGGPDPVDAYRAGGREFNPSTDGVEVRPFGSGGVEIHFRAARHVGVALMTTGILLIWCAIIVLLAHSKAPKMFPVVFGLLGLLLFIGVLYLWFGSAHVQVAGGKFRVRQGLWGGGRFKEVDCAGVKSVSLKQGMQVGNRMYYDIRVECHDGKTLAAGNSIRDHRHAERLAEEIRQAVDRNREQRG